MLQTLNAWLPTWREFVEGITYVNMQTAEQWPHVALKLRASHGYWLGPDFFADASIYTGLHWEIPLTAIALYLVLIVVGPKVMANRDPLPINNLVCCWNFFLSAFSFVGMLLTWNAIIHKIATEGVEGSICAHPVFMGHGWIGWAMFLFIYSKLFELLDTAFLVAKKTPVIFLHWYHHVTVLLYCWHSYAVRIPSGIWFAAMNYCVHFIMYGYFGMTQLGPKYRKMVRPYAQLITTLQISQMGVGLTVNALTIHYMSLAHECFNHKTNTILSWIMYLSYFVLFGLLYLRNYILNKPKQTGIQTHADHKANGKNGKNGKAE